MFHGVVRFDEIIRRLDSLEHPRLVALRPGQVLAAAALGDWDGRTARHSAGAGCTRERHGTDCPAHGGRMR